ncbi:hypothetical protein QCA50_014633 [Cerrena zonata]|uniref:T6SS Phospholipase effector Tle1-like catalytic domain-containing protein n=1 Tax=Cerrena zonata TaxID=2478898 RepID=A0AAW0FXU3_9APHY
MGRPGAEFTTLIPPSAPSRGSRCICGKPNRNLVVCIDGTSSKFGDHNTNVINFYNLLHKNDKQKTFYNSGIGTYATPTWKTLSHWRKVVNSLLDLAFAIRFETIVLDAYRWLSEHYQEGDRIFLLGFSRGAYQVRVLAAMIHKVGLIHAGNTAQIPFAFEIYASIKTEVDDMRGLLRAQKFRQTFSRTVQVHFVGVWDTVSAIGIIHGKPLPFTTTGMTNVCLFRHALALDERRVKFIPEYYYPNDEAQLPDIKEVWFVGCHGDIGGGIVSGPQEHRHYDEPLRWMYYEAIKAGILLGIPLPNRDWITNSLDTRATRFHESLKGLWKALEYMPIVPKHKRQRKGIFRSFHLCDGRKIIEGQKIHASVLRILREPYSPRAQLPVITAWTQMSDQHPDWIEKDFTDETTHILDKIVTELDSPRDRARERQRYLTLEKVSKTDEGRHALLINPNAKKLFECFKNLTITDQQCLSSIMSTLLNFAADEETHFYKYDELYPAERISLFRTVESLDLSHAEAIPAGRAYLFARFFHRFSSGVGSSHYIRRLGQIVVLSAGEIQGIYRDAIFDIYSNPNCTEESVIGTAIVTGTRALTSVVNLTFSVDTPISLDSYYTSCLPTSPGSNWALRVAFHREASNKFRLEVLKSLDDLRKKSPKRLPVVIVADNEEPDFILSQGLHHDYSFKATDSSWERHPDLKSTKPEHLKSEYLSGVVYGSAIYYWYFHLPQASRESSQAIELTWFEDARPEGFTNYFKTDQCQIGPIPTGPSQTMYGCKITNLDEDGLFIHVFVLKPSSHSITCFSSHKDMNQHRVDPQSTIIFHSKEEEKQRDPSSYEWRGDAMPFSIPSDQEKDVSYLVILLSKSYIDYMVSDLPSPFTTVFDFQRAWEENSTVQPWRTIFIPIIIIQEMAEEEELNEEVTAPSFPPETISSSQT